MDALALLGLSAIFVGFIYCGHQLYLAVREYFRK